MKLSDLDQQAYLIKEICDERQVSPTCRKLLESFHQRLNFEVTKRKHYWYARAHKKGVTYFYDDRKAYLYLDVNQEFLSMKFFTGKGKIKGLAKSTWSQSDETIGSERYRITDDDSLERAIGFALKAYRFAEDWSAPNNKGERTLTIGTIDNEKSLGELQNKRLSKFLSAVAKRIADRIDSLDAVFRFKRSGIEGWLKVEMAAALGDELVSLNNRGPDMTFTEGLLIELKAATDFNPSYLRDGALKDNVPCMFIGNGEDKRNIERLTSMTEIRVVGLEYLSGIHTWVVGCIVPELEV